MKHPAGLLLFREISVVRRGAIPGAGIISRRELKSPVKRSAPVPSRGAVPSGWSVLYDEHGREISRQPQQKIRRYFDTVGGQPIARRSAKLERALAAPDDGYATTYDEAGNVLQRIPLYGAVR